MLELKNITKDYLAGENTVHALKGVSMAFRDSEFVSILGPSGCGKTTTLNIVGGLDRYTDGNLLIDGVSTKNYDDKDWDIYRNNKVGFVFQSYNLIPHQTVLSNVELALTIANVPKAERIERAKEALIKVGLENEMHKYPRQMSGGQMQRVAIARAIVNNPKILLADEPTGALDSKTSVQVMNILKELSKDCLIVMVTHNQELANEYSTRIITLSDGEMVSDSNPYTPEVKEETVENVKDGQKKKKRKVGMPFITSLKLSFSNLRSKIGRTILTCFAGSIGIIGIALVLSISTGFNNYIDSIEESTLTQYPLTINKANLDYSSIFLTFMTSQTASRDPNVIENDIVPNYVMVKLLQSFTKATNFNDLIAFRTYIEAHRDLIDPYVLQLSYDYHVNINAFDGDRYDYESILRLLEPFNIPETDENGNKLYLFTEEYDSKKLSQMMRSLAVWDEMYKDLDVLKGQYDLISGSWPGDNGTNATDVVFVVDETNRVSDFQLYSTGVVVDDTGYTGDQYVIDLFKYVNDPKNNPNPADHHDFHFTYDQILGNYFYIIPDSLYYKQKSQLGFELIDEANSEYDSYIRSLIDDPNSGVIKVRISGIVRPNSNSDTHSIDGTIGYTNALKETILLTNLNSKVVKTQIENPDKCIVYLGSPITAGMEWEDLIQLMKNSQSLSDGTWDNITPEYLYNLYLDNFGYIEVEGNEVGNITILSPNSISFYPKSFEDKDQVINFIEEYNKTRNTDEEKISYTDYVGSIMGSVTTIVNAVTYVLIGFVSVSLVVSSIMIAVITYISVLERTKEIGILRAMGAAKRDVRNIFNAETFITGLISGVLGILITLILNIPICLIIKHLADINNIATLPFLGAVSLIVLSFILSVVAGFIPSGYATKCDPVIALRSE